LHEVGKSPNVRLPLHDEYEAPVQPDCHAIRNLVHERIREAIVPQRDKPLPQGQGGDFLVAPDAGVGAGDIQLAAPADRHKASAGPRAGNDRSLRLKEVSECH